MNIMQLKYFIAVCTYNKVSDAAKFLHISQPSLSNAIKELENEFGIILFHRRYAGMELTSEGKTFLELARGILKDVEQAELVMSGLGNKRKNLRLGVPPMIGALVMPRIFKDFCSKNSDIKLEITEAGREELDTLLLSGDLDIIFTPHSGPLDNKLLSKNISKLEVVCCVSPNNVLSLKKSISFAELKDVPIVLFKNSFFQTEQIKQRFLLSGVNPNIMLQTDQLSTIQSLVENNLCAGFMFRNLIKGNSAICALSLNDEFGIDVSLAWRKNYPVTDSMKRFIDFTFECKII